MISTQDISLNLKKMREEKKLGISEVSEKLMFPRQTIYDYEAGNHTPNLAKLAILCEYYGIGVDMVLLPHSEFVVKLYEKPAALDIEPWYMTEIAKLLKMNTALHETVDRLTRILEVLQNGSPLGKFSGYPQSTTEANVFEIFENKDAVGESVEFEPLKEAA